MYTMTVEPFRCELDPDTGIVLEIHLIKDVQNIEFIRNNILNGSWNCSLIKPSLILDPFQVAVAANRAVVARTQNAMITRSIFTEILFNLSLSKNISASLKKFGVDMSNVILVCFLKTPDVDCSEEILSKIEGERCPMTELSSFTDLNQVKQTYKLNNIKCNDEMLDVIVSKMVTKSFVAH